MALILTAWQSEQLLAACSARLPEEACGLLIGRVEGAALRITRVVEARNLAGENRRERFELHPEDFLAAERAAGDAGHRIVGVWHSHPQSSAVPSALDREQAFAGWSYLIVGCTAIGEAELRSWRLVDGAFREEALLVAPAGEPALDQAPQLPFTNSGFPVPFPASLRGQP
jgi:proteasome lid subunit RPN8/RPN11